MVLKRFISSLFILAAIVLLAVPHVGAAADDKPVVHVVPVTGVIGPATYDLIKREIAAADRAKAALLVLQMDTPGGLYDSTQQIVQAILDSPVPVATLVAPSGAHAASAGTYILYASHIAAMAPSTRIGAATPVTLSGDGDQDKKTPSALEKKMLSDASAFIRGLAERHKRNADWAEAAVRNAESLTASEALSRKVIETIATSASELADKVHGRSVIMANDVKKTLETRGAEIITRTPGLRHDLLEIITHPNIALLLMTLGTYGLIYEFANPGALVPGVIGAIFLLLGLYAMNVLPVNFSGLALLMLGLALMTAEAFTVTFGILGIGGAIAFVCGAILLMKADMLGGLMIDPWLIGLLAVLSFAVLSISLGMVVKSLRQKTVTGKEELLGATATVTRWQGDHGDVLVTGEIWQARCASPHVLKQGDTVQVSALDGLVLVVTPVSSLSSPPQGEPLS